MDNKKLVYGIGINDCKGWSTHRNKPKEDLKYRIYNLWHHMLMRAYSPKLHKQCPTYKGVTVCERWHRLSNFAEDIVNIPNYELWRDNPRQFMTLDKDTKIANNKHYCLEACVFLTKQESSRDVFTRCQAATKTPEAKRKNVASRMRAIICTYPDGTSKKFESMAEAERQGFSRSYIRVCLNKPHRSHKGCKFQRAEACF